MNNKIVSVVLVAGIAATGFAGISAANETSLKNAGDTQVNSVVVNPQSGDADKINFTKGEMDSAININDLTPTGECDDEHKGSHGHGKRKGQANLTSDEKLSLESMDNDEKKAFFEAKHDAMKAKKESGKLVIDTLIAGGTLTAEQEATRLEMIADMDSHGKTHQKPGAQIIAKVLAGDELTADEEAQLVEMKEKREEREAIRAQSDESGLGFGRLSDAEAESMLKRFQEKGDNTNLVIVEDTSK